MIRNARNAIESVMVAISGWSADHVARRDPEKYMRLAQETADRVNDRDAIVRFLEESGRGDSPLAEQQRRLAAFTHRIADRVALSGEDEG